MPNLPPFFNGKISGILTISISDISWFKNDVRNTFIQFEWSGSHEKHKLLTSKYSKISYDIRTSYKSFIKYLSTCILKCSVKSNENNSFAFATMKNISISPVNQLVKTLPLINNEKTVGTLKLCFDLQTFNDTSFDNEIKCLKKNGILSEVLNPANDKEFYYSDLFKPTKSVRPVSSLSLRTNRSKEELTSDYLMGKDMAPEEEEEALNTLRIMPSAESMVSAAEKISIYSPLHIQGNSKIMTNIRPNVKNMKRIKTNLKKPCLELNKREIKMDYFKPLQKVPIPKDDVYLHLSILSINVYRTIKSLQNYFSSTYIVQCLKDQEPYKLLRFMSRHMDDNVVKFNASILSCRLEGGTVNGITIRSYVRTLSERSSIVLGETKQMLDWTGFSTNFDDLRFIKVPIWNNNKIIGHLSLSYAFSNTPVVQKYEDLKHFPIKHLENIIDIEYSEKQQCEFTTDNISKSVVSEIKKNAKDFEDKTLYLAKDQIYNGFYPSQINENIIESQLFLDEQPNKEPTKAMKEKRNQLFLDERPIKEPTKALKEKETQTNFKVHQFNKSVQTLVKMFNVAIQVDSDELEDPLDKTVCCDVQNIFRCTHEFTYHIEKKCNSTFNYVTYQFPECVTTNTGKVITCHRMLRTFGNTNILHLITLPTTVSLESYFYNNYKRSAIVLNLHQNNDYLPGKISLPVSHMIVMADQFKTSYITKHLILKSNSSMHELPCDNVHIKIYYKRVYHKFPSPDKQLRNSCDSQKSLKKNSKMIVDLTESDSDETFINKTYTLFKCNDKFDDATVENSTQTDPFPVKIYRNCKTQTEKDMKQQCITTYDSCNSIENKSESTAQLSKTVIVENQLNQINTKSREFNTVIDTFDDNIFKAKVIIVGGYNLPMVKLNGETVPSAPTSYVILDNFIGSSLSTSSVVQQVNPVWNSEWTLILPKNKLIEGKWLILELWCKKYRNEYAGHDAKRDIRLGCIFIDLCALEYNFNQAGGLYDVISETEEHNGKIKVIFSLINKNTPKTNVNYESQPINESTADKTTKEKIIEKSNNNLINELIGRLKIENNYIDSRKYENPMTVRSAKHFEYVDLTENSPKKCCKTSLKDTFSESCLKNTFINNDYQSTIETISSVTSWTSSSDDILCSNNNSRTVNNILSNETKMNRIKQIIQS